MNTTFEIIEMCLSGEKPTVDELRYTVCVLSALMFFDKQALDKLRQAEEENKKPFLSYSAVFQFEKRFNRVKAAYSKQPLEWLGDENNPDKIDFQVKRKMYIEMYEKLINKKENK